MLIELQVDIISAAVLDKHTNTPCILVLKMLCCPVMILIQYLFFFYVGAAHCSDTGVWCNEFYYNTIILDQFSRKQYSVLCYQVQFL